MKVARELRSWVQIIPPGPFLSVIQLRYYSKFNFLMSVGQKAHSNLANDFDDADRDWSYFIERLVEHCKKLISLMI
jgi:hypothetical protein